MNILLCRGTGVLQSCVMSSDKANLLKLLKSNINVNSVNQYNESALYVAAYFSESDLLKILLESGADVNSATIDGNTALHAAAYHGNTEIMKTLVEFGADPTIRNLKSSTANDILLEFLRMQTMTCSSELTSTPTTALNTSQDFHKKSTLFERLRCRTLDKKDNVKKVSRIKAIRTKFGTLFTDSFHVLRYSTTIPVIKCNELKKENNSTDWHNGFPFIMEQSSNWRGLPVMVKRPNQEDLNDNASLRDINLILQNQVARELEILSRIQHPFIMNPLAVLVSSTNDLMCLDPKEIGVVYERPYLGSLHHFTKIRLEEIPILSVLSIFRQLAEAILFLQSSGIAHCNVTPRSVYLFAIDAVKLGNFEHAIEIGYTNKSEFEVRCSNTGTGSRTSGHTNQTYSWSSMSRSQSSKSSNRSTLEAAVSRLLMCATQLPADHLADWLPPELFDDHANSTVTHMNSMDTHSHMNERWTCPVSFATDVYSLGKLLQSLLSPSYLTTEPESLTHSADEPITNIRLLLKAALQPRPEERLPLKQFHRLLIHLFWNEYDSIRPPKPYIKNPIPCPLRLCTHHPIKQQPWDKKTKNMVPIKSSHKMRQPRSNSGSQTLQPTMNENDSQGVPFVNTDNITYRKRSGIASKHVDLERSRPEADQGLWTPGSTDTSTVLTNTPSTPVSKLCIEGSQNRNISAKMDFNGHHRSAELNKIRLTSELYSPSSIGAARQQKNTVNDVSNFQEDKSISPTTNPRVENHVAYFSVPCENTANASNLISKDKPFDSEKQEFARTKLSRFYPFINDWLKHKRITCTDADSSAGSNMFDTKCSMTVTPFSRVYTTKPLSGASTSVEKPLSSCLQRASSRKSKSVKLSHTEYMQFAAVPCVPEGVEVPPDLVPHRTLSAPQPRSNLRHRSQTVSVEKESIQRTVFCQRSSSVLDHMICKSTKPIDGFSVLSTSFNSEHMPVKPASHLTHTPIATCNYADVTGKPDLIRSSSRLSRRLNHKAHLDDAGFARSSARIMSTTCRWVNPRTNQRTQSCSDLVGQLYLSNGEVRVRSTSTQTETIRLCNAPCCKVSPTKEQPSSSTDMSSTTGVNSDTLDSHPPAPRSFCDFKGDYKSAKSGIGSKEKQNGSHPDRRSFSAHVTRVGRLVAMFESKKDEVTSEKRDLRVCRPLWTPQLGLRDTSPHPRFPRSLTRIEASGKLPLNFVESTIQRSTVCQDLSTCKMLKVDGIKPISVSSQTQVNMSVYKTQENQRIAESSPFETKTSIKSTAIGSRESELTDSQIPHVYSPRKTEENARTQLPPYATYTKLCPETRDEAKPESCWSTYPSSTQGSYQSNNNLRLQDSKIDTIPAELLNFNPSSGKTINETVLQETDKVHKMKFAEVRTLQDAHASSLHEGSTLLEQSTSSLNWLPPPPSPLDQLFHDADQWDKENIPVENRPSLMDNEYQSFLTIPFPGCTVSENSSNLEPLQSHSIKTHRTPFTELKVVSRGIAPKSQYKECLVVDQMKHRTDIYATRMHGIVRECGKPNIDLP